MENVLFFNSGVPCLSCKQSQKLSMPGHPFLQFSPSLAIFSYFIVLYTIPSFLLPTLPTIPFLLGYSKISQAILASAVRLKVKLKCVVLANSSLTLAAIQPTWFISKVPPLCFMIENANTIGEGSKKMLPFIRTKCKIRLIDVRFNIG